MQSWVSAMMPRPSRLHLQPQGAANRDGLPLHVENPDYPTIVVQPGEPFEIEGLAVGLIRNSMLM